MAHVAITETKAAAHALATGTLDPDAPPHRFAQLLTYVESQTRPARGASQVPLEPHKFLKEQRELIGRDARTLRFHLQTHQRRRTGLRRVNADLRIPLNHICS